MFKIFFSLDTSNHQGPGTTSANVSKTEQDRRIRIVHVAQRLVVAGMGHVVASLVRGMPKHRYNSSIWCIEEADVLGRQLQAEGHNMLELGRRRRRDFGLFFRMASLLQENQIDILHCHDELSWFYGTIAAWLARRSQVLVTMHGRRPDISFRHRFEQRLLALGSRTIIAVSAYLHRQLIDEIHASPAKILTIYNGVPLPVTPTNLAQRYLARRMLGLPENAIVIGSVGRLAEVKRFDLLIKAAADAYATIPELRVVLIGEGSCREDLVRTAAATNIDTLVTFTGLRQDVSELLPAFDFYVCSSDYEGISLSILEAMAAGLSVIATAVGGNTEIIRHGENGILVPKGNRSTLTQAIINLARNETERYTLGKEGQTSVVNMYSIAQMIKEYDHLYQDVLGLYKLNTVSNN